MSRNQYRYLAPEPLSGKISLTGNKFLAELFLVIASLIVFGTTLDNRAISGCNETGLCVYYMVISFFSFFVAVILLLINCLIELKMAQRSALPFGVEFQIFKVFLAVWVITIILFNLNNNPYKSIRVGQSAVTFAWVIFLDVLYICYVLYHIRLEENIYKELTAKWEKDLRAKEVEIANMKS